MHRGRFGRFDVKMFQETFVGKKVLVTGHTGFKGCWLTNWLVSMGAKVFGYALPPATHEVLFDQLQLRSRLDHEVIGDIRDAQKLSSEIGNYQPDFVFHLAAQPLVRTSYQMPRETFETNVIGTVNVLDSLIGYSKPCSVVVVTTDKCYENQEWLHSYREEDPLGGYDPYSASKGCAEIVTAAYRRSFFTGTNNNGGASEVRIATARAGNVIGGGDWALDRIVPDVMRCVLNHTVVPVRNKRSTRPWQHVLEPLSGYLWLAAHLHEPKLSEYPNSYICSAFNFGPELDSNRTVADLVESLLKHTGGNWADVSSPVQPHEAYKLNLAIDKAFHVLGWRPTWKFDTCVEQTAHWYTTVCQGGDPIEETDRCLRKYLDDATAIKQSWACSN